MPSDNIGTNWENIVKKYLIIKKLFIDCEETDRELRTNLQPYNEFKAALDHIVRLISKEKNIAQDILFSDNEESKLNGHLNRAFFDICDMLSINYRRKIIELLKPYNPDTIAKVIPDYYVTIKPRIEEINMEISKLRNDKGQRQQDEDIQYENYTKMIEELKGYYKEFEKKEPSLIEIQQAKDETAATLNKNERNKLFIPLIVTSALSIGGILATILVSVL